MTLIEILRANGSWEADAAVTAIRVRDMRIEKLEAALRRIKHMHEGRGIDDIEERDDRTYFIVCNALGETP